MVKFFLLIAFVFSTNFMGLPLQAHAAKRILFVDSYHNGYAYSDGIRKGVESILDGQDVELKIHFMDTKRNKDEAFIKKAAIDAKAVIAAFAPDIVITAADNAANYLIRSYYKKSSLPFIFCGVKFSADEYGFPTSNITGILEVPPSVKLVYCLKYFKRIQKIGYLASDTETDRKVGLYLSRDTREDIMERYVKKYSQWKTAYNQMQKEVDVLVLGNNAGIEGWDSNDAKTFALTNSNIPVGCMLPWMADYAFIAVTPTPIEQGRYAAETAMEVLNGRRISTIPIKKNEEVLIIINNKISKKLGITIPKSFKERASKIIE